MIEFQNNPPPEPDYLRLMLHKVYEILLVASPYDAFILEEDGRLSEQIITEYLDMRMRNAPRIWQASTATQALDMIDKRKFDLIIVMMRIPDMNPIAFSAKIKELYPKKPVILLLFDESELKQIPENLPKKTIDCIFIYSGNADVFPAIIKFVEDRQNVSRDIRIGDVRAVILIEDNPKYYSLILPMIYKEILYHNLKLISKTVDESRVLLKKIGRPKILLATTFEEARYYFSKFHDNIFGIISDIRFPKNGVLRERAGIEFARWARKKEPHIPVLLQSTDYSNSKLAKEASVGFLHKGSVRMLQQLRKFILNNFGFGDFLFRVPSGEIVGVAQNPAELKDLISRVPDETLIFHASHNHFSNWLAARGEFSIATKLHHLQISDFDSMDALRSFLIGEIEGMMHKAGMGRITNFSDDVNFDSANFLRISPGSLGGKARGLAFANSMLEQSDLKEKFSNVVIRIPKVMVVGTDEFDHFMEVNQLWEPMVSLIDSEIITNLFLKSKLSDELVEKLKFILTKITGPLAVRSSSLLEDAQYNPLAGAYSTYMLQNSDPELDNRLDQLCEAVKRVFASMFYHRSKSVIVASHHRFESEKMAVIIQELVGRRFKDRFYPVMSGVAQSYNYYPVSYMKRDEGVAYLALGFGKTIVDGEKSLRFSPKYPAILPQYYSVKSTIQNSQNNFYALKFGPEQSILTEKDPDNLSKYPLETAEADGMLRYTASVISAQDGVLRDSLNYEGVRVITFAHFLKYKLFPLSEILDEILTLGSRSLGCPVEIEFAVNIFNDAKRLPEFCLLQIKPLPLSSVEQSEELDGISEDSILCRTNVCLGNGKIEGLQNILYVKPEVFDASKTTAMAKELEKFNKKLGARHPYILIGPGRWGSADPWLGIPVVWNQISNVKVMVEMGLAEFEVDPSFGSHFFQNVTSMRIGYFTVSHKGRLDKLDRDWLARQYVVEETEFLAWIKLEEPLVVQMDGLSGKGIIYKPHEQKEEHMDEEDSTGI